MADDIKKVAWNASEGLIFELAKRRSMANSYFIQGDIAKAFNTLISIKQSVIQSFKEDEREELKKIEDNFSTLSSALVPSMSSSFNTYQRRLYIDAKTLAKRMYSKYNDRLMDLLEQYGYLIGEATDASKMKF